MHNRTIISAGVIIYRMYNGIREYLILQYTAGHWDLPKGKTEKGESLQKTALRELQEETGITNVSLDPHFKKSFSYEFKDMHDNPQHKTVFFFLGEVSATERIVLSQEHTHFAWITADKANKLSYYNAQEIVLATDMYLQKRG